MASSIQLLRSTNTQERPFPNNLLEGQPAVNLNASEPGLFFKAADGSLVKFGPAAITSDGSPPNSSPQGSSGNTVGELWLDKSINPAVLKVYDGTAWVDAGSGGGGGGGDTANFVRWIYTAAGGETSLSGSSGGVLLEYTPGLEEVYVNGVLITRGTDYSATNGTSITNLAALTAGDVITVMSMNPLETVQLPGQVTLLRWTVLATSGQTVISGVDSSGQQLEYTPGLEEVYINGVFLRRGIDYVAENGSTITGFSPLTENDEVTVLGWSPFTIGDQINNENVADNANISYSKLNLLSSIVDADISDNAAINSSKLSFLQDGAGAITRTVAARLKDVISVKDFGAVGDGRNDSPAFQAAIDYALENNISIVYVPFSKGEKYNLIDTVVVHPMSLTLYGDAAPLVIPNNSPGYIYSTTKAGTLFNFGGDQSGGGAVRLIGLNFYSQYPFYTSDAQTAVKFTDTSNGPARPVNIRDCSARGFKYKFLFDSLGTGNLAPSFINIEGCNFSQGEYTVYVKPPTSIIGLRVVGNLLEQGGAISGAVRCYCDIKENLFEGQPNPTTIEGIMVGHTMLDGNYYEANSGDYLLSFKPSNPTSPLTLGYFYRAARPRHLDTVLIPDGAQIVSIDATVRAISSQSTITLDRSEIGPNCSGFSTGYNMALTRPTEDKPYWPAQGWFQTVLPNPSARSILNANEFVGTTSYTGAKVTTSIGSDGPILTPHGISTTASFMTGGLMFERFSEVSVSAGDIVVTSVLVKYTDVEPTPNPSGFATIAIYDRNATHLYKADIFGNAFIRLTYNNQWKLLTLSFKVKDGDPTSNSIRAYFYPYGSGSKATTGSGCWIAGFGFHSYTPPEINKFEPSTMRTHIRPIYPVL